MNMLSGRITDTIPSPRVAPALRDAHQAMEYAMHDLRGLVIALEVVLLDSGLIDEASRSAAPVWALVNSIEAKSKEAVDLLAAQWIAAGGAA